MHVHDLFRGGALLEEEAATAFTHLSGEGALDKWLRKLDLVLIELFGDDKPGTANYDPDRREKAIMMITETVAGAHLLSEDKATKGGAWYMRARGDWQLAACCGEYIVGADHVIAGRLGRGDFTNEGTHKSGVMAAVRRQVGDDLSAYGDARVDYSLPPHPVFLAIASNDLEALAALRPASPLVPLQEQIDDLKERVEQLEKEV